MSSGHGVEKLLEAWEDRRENQPDLSLANFTEEHGADLTPAELEEFRQKAVALMEMDDKLKDLGVNSLKSCSAADANKGDHSVISDLQSGWEPIPGYSLVARLGSGGFGEVWKADSPGGFHVALKFVRLEGKSSEVEQRALEVIKDVRHPHLLATFGTWQIDDFLVIAMELADRTLLDRFQEAVKEGYQGIPRDELFEYLAEAAKGIDHLNAPQQPGQLRIQHRDIKPQNLLLSGNSVKVGDFGLARSLQYEATGHTGILSLAYAAPECFDGITSNRSDQYSLAMTYCHLRGGRLPAWRSSFWSRYRCNAPSGSSHGSK